MPRVAPPDTRALIVRNPVLTMVRVGCMQHPDAVMCVEFQDGETKARFHLAGFSWQMVDEPEHRCGDCNRADGRCEYASPLLVKALIAAGQSMEEIHQHGKRMMQPSIDAQNALER